MTCKCGKEISNVPEHLRDLVDWVCHECSNTPPASSLVSLTATGALDVSHTLDTKALKTEHAA